MRDEFKNKVFDFMNRGFQEVKTEAYQMIKLNENEAVAIDFKSQEIFYIKSATLKKIN